MRQNAPSSSRHCFEAQDRLEMRSQQTQSHGCHPAPTAIKTQPLSKPVLLACADQSARQRKMGIAKKNVAKALDDYLAKEGFFKTNPQELSTLCIYPKTPEQHKECVNQQNTVYFNSCPILYPATYEEHPMNNNDLDRVRLLNTCCITQKVRC